jgi:hypothetical protein
MGAARMTRHLVLVAWERREETMADLRRIARRVSELDPSIAVHIVSKRQRDQLKLLWLWPRPTLSLAFIDVTKRKLLPGRFISGRRLGKRGEYVRMDAAGIPVPRWQVILPETRLDPAEWGPFVVEKPDQGRVGANIRIRRTSRVSYVAPEALPNDHYGRRGPMLAQQFIYTGERPSSYRVVTFFGEVLASYRQTTRDRGPPLRGRWAFRDTGGISIVSNTRSMEVELDGAPDVVALAERTHRLAFGDIPLLGIDIVRDADTGELFVLECHAHGTAWMFSSQMGLSIQAANRIDLASQYDGMEKAARILARITPSLAASRWAARTHERWADLLSFAS